MALTAQTLLYGPARHSCASRTSGGALLPSHGLNVLACGASLVVAAAAMTVAAMAVMGTSVMLKLRYGELPRVEHSRESWCKKHLSVTLNLAT